MNYLIFIQVQIRTTKAFDVANAVTPNVGTTYSVNREFFDMVDTRASVPI